MTGGDARTDHNFNAGILRALPLMTDSFAQETREQPGVSDSDDSPEWAALVEADAATRTEITWPADMSPEPTDYAAELYVDVTVEWLSRKDDRPLVQSDQALWVVKLTRPTTTSQWLVSTVALA